MCVLTYNLVFGEIQTEGTVVQLQSFFITK